MLLKRLQNIQFVSIGTFLNVIAKLLNSHFVQESKFHLARKQFKRYFIETLWNEYSDTYFMKLWIVLCHLFFQFSSLRQQCRSPVTVNMLQISIINVPLIYISLRINARFYKTFSYFFPFKRIPLLRILLNSADWKVNAYNSGSSRIQICARSLSALNNIFPTLQTRTLNRTKRKKKKKRKEKKRKKEIERYFAGNALTFSPHTNALRLYLILGLQVSLRKIQYALRATSKCNFFPTEKNNPDLIPERNEEEFLRFRSAQ